MFRKPKNKSAIRQRQTNAEEPEQNSASIETDNGDAKPTSLMDDDDDVTPIRTEPKKASLLSFGDEDEEEGEIFKLKKDKKKLKDARRMKRLEEQIRDVQKVEIKEEIDEELEFTVIPTGLPVKEAVYEARKRREKLRLQGHDGYIPLDDDQKIRQKGIRNRLFREDENDDSDEDTEKFYSSRADALEEDTKRREQQTRFLEQEEAERKDSDEEMERWEQQQILKAVGAATIGQVKHEYELTTQFFQRSTIAENKESLRKLEFGDGDKQSTAKELSEKYKMYQDMKLYVRSLLDCLDEKAPEINDLIAKRRGIEKARLQRLIARRRKDVGDSYDECSAAAAGKNIATIRVGEHGMRAAEREGRRGRRRREREGQLQGISHEDGLSTDDEETTSRIVADNEGKAELNAALQVVFVDALDEYSNISKVLDRIIDWLVVDGKSFQDAYVHLCIPKLLSPYVRLQLCQAEILKDPNFRLDDQAWYTDILTAGASSEIDPQHPVVVGLLPAIVEKVVVPYLTELVADEWDPLSFQQTQNLTTCLNTIIREYPTITSKSKMVNRLANAIQKRAKDSVSEDIFIPIDPSVIIKVKALIAETRNEWMPYMNMNSRKQVALVIERYERIARDEINSLKRLHVQIVEGNNRKENTNALQAQAKRVEDQLLKGLAQVMSTRAELEPESCEEFDLKIEPVRLLIQSEEDEPNIYAEEARLQMEKTMNKNSELKIKAEEARLMAEESVRLEADVQDLNEIFTQLQTIVHQQHDMVDSIEEHVEQARSQVERARSPSPTYDRIFSGGQIAIDEDLHDHEGMTEEELKREMEEREMQAQAQILEIVGDLRSADDVPPENVLFKPEDRLNAVNAPDLRGESRGTKSGEIVAGSTNGIRGENETAVNIGANANAKSSSTVGARQSSPKRARRDASPARKIKKEVVSSDDERDRRDRKDKKKEKKQRRSSSGSRSPSRHRRR
ncbi:unnamed protein product, partial [Mesorhabditis spiculigera]